MAKAKAKYNPNGYIVYRGPSMLTGDPIIGVVTTVTTNDKTGAMLQLWILRADIEPHTAVAAGDDKAICGNCPQAAGAGCYVTVFQAPLSVYRTAARGRYRDISSDPAAVEALGRGRLVRFGAYGDPAALPAAVGQSLGRSARGFTGYTHQIKHRGFDPAWLDFAMVSCETPEQAAAQHALGRRTFRATHDTTALLPGEIVCSADAYGITCEQCLGCDGANRPGA